VPLAPNVDESLVARAGVRVELAPEALDLDVGHAGRLVVVRLPVADVGRPGRDDVEVARPDDGLLGVERAQVRLERAVPALLVGEALEALAGVGDVCRWEDEVRGRSREGRCRAGSEREDERGLERDAQVPTTNEFSNSSVTMRPSESAADTSSLAVNPNSTLSGSTLLKMAVPAWPFLTAPWSPQYRCG